MHESSARNHFPESHDMTDLDLRSRSWRAHLASVLVWTMVLHPLLPLAALAAPQDANVVNGDVTIETTGDTTVITASDLSIIEYSSFDIGSNETVQFIQPHELAKVLNRIDSAMPTMIEGTLLANGHVYIVNPAGVFFGAGSVVDVGAITAAAAHISNEDFLAGIDRFTDAEGAVENYGEITAKSAALIGRHVANYGSIKADGGMIILAAGEDVLIGQRGDRMYLRIEGVLAEGAENTTGVENHGTLDAGDGVISLAAGDLYGMAIHHTGSSTASDIQIAGGDEGVVEVSGTLDASNDDGVGGSISVTGDKVALIGAIVDASGSAGGGKVRIGGDVRGEGELRTANRTYVDQDSVIRADATDAGDGGSVVVWGDEAAVNYGAISATGGAESGDGGFVEISSLGLLVDDGSVDLTAENGRSGTLLYDPQDIVIFGGTADGDDAPDANDDLLDPASVLFGDDDARITPFAVYESEIEGTDANIVLEARNSITTDANFLTDSTDDTVTVMADNDLTMRTQNDADDGTTPIDSPITAGINLDAGATFTTSGTGSILIESATDGAGDQADVSVGTLTTGGGTIDVTSGNGDVSFAALNSSGGDVAVTAATGAGPGLGGSITAGTVAAGTGDVTLTADDMSLAGSIAGDEVNLQEATAGTTIDLGEANVATDPDLGLTNAELANITANTLRIGSADAGAIVISGAIDTSAIAETSLISAGAVATTVGSITADGLRVDSAGATIDGANVNTLSASMSGDNNDFTFTNEVDGFTVGSVDGTDGISTADATSGSGDITLSSVGGIVVSQAITTGDDLVADVAAMGDAALSGSINVTSTGGSVTGTAALTTGSATVAGTDATDTAESGVIMITADSGDVQLSAADALATGDSAAGAGEAGVGDMVISANSFSDGAMGGVDVSQGTATGATSASVGVFEATTDVGGIRVASGEDLQVGPLQTTNAIISVDSAGALTLTDNMTAGGGNVELLADAALSSTSSLNTVASNGDVTLEGTTIGSDAAPIRIDGGGTADSTLLVSADGEVDVNVANAGFNAIGVTQADASENIDIVQVDADGNDVIDINGSGTTSTIFSVDTNSSGNAVEFAYELTEAGGDVEITTGTMNLGGDTIIQAANDLTVGTAAGTAIMTNGNDLALVADANNSGTGAIVDGAAGGSAVIDMGSTGNLVLQATDEIGATGDLITLANGDDLAAASDAGGIYVENTTGGSLDVTTVTVNAVGETAMATGVNADVDGGGAAAADDVILLNSATNGDVTITQNVTGFDVAIRADRDIIDGGGTIAMQGGDLQLVGGQNVGQDSGSEIEATGVADLAISAGTGDAHVNAQGANVNLTTVFLEGTAIIGATAEVDLEIRNAMTDGDITLTQAASGDNVTLDADRDILRSGASGVINMQGLTPDLQLRAGRNIGIDGTEIIANQVQDLAAVATDGDIHLVANGAGVNVTTVDLHGTMTTGVTAPNGMSTAGAGDVELRNTTTDGNITIMQNVKGERVTIAADGSIIDGGGTIDMDGGALQLIAGTNVGQDAGSEIEAQDVTDFAALASGGDVHVNVSGATTNVNVTTVDQHGVAATTGVSAPTTTGTAGDVELRNVSTNGDVTITQNVRGERVTIQAAGDIFRGGTGLVDMEGGALQLIAGGDIGTDGNEVVAQDVTDVAASAGDDLHLFAGGSNVDVTTVNQHSGGTATTGVVASNTGELELRNTVGTIDLEQQVSGQNITVEAATDLTRVGATGVINVQNGGDLQLIAGNDLGADGTELIANGVADFGASAGNDLHVFANGANVDVTTVNQHSGGTATVGVTASNTGELELRNNTGQLDIEQQISGQSVTLEAATNITRNGGSGVINMQGAATLAIVAGGNVGATGDLIANNVSGLAVRAAAGGTVGIQANGADVSLTSVNQHGTDIDGVSSGSATRVATASITNTDAAGDLTVGGDSVAADTVTLASTGAGGNILNGGGTIDANTVNLTADGNIGGTGDGVSDAMQVVNAADDMVTLETVMAGGDAAIAAPMDGIVIGQNIEAGDVDGTLQLDTPLTIELDTDTQTVAAGNDLLLNANVVVGAPAGNQFQLQDPTGTLAAGQGSPVATIYRMYTGTAAAPTSPGATTLSAGNDLRTGGGQRLTTPGDLTLMAGGDVAATDVTVVGQLTVAATNASFGPRGGSQLFDNSGTLGVDTAHDVIANSFDFGATNVNGNGGFLGSPDGSATANGFIPALIFNGGGALQVSDVVGQQTAANGVDGLVLDVAVGGVRPPENSFVPPIPEEVTLTGGLLSELNQAAAARKPVWGSEVVTVLTCSLYEGEDPDLVPAECKEQAEKEKSDPRFQTEPMVQARALYQQLYQDVDPLLDALQDAADGYLEGNPGTTEIGGEAFREYVTRSQGEALQFLKQLSTLFSLLDQAMSSGGGDPGGVEELRTQLLDDITPAGMSPDELNEAIQATPATPRTAGIVPLAAADGLARALGR